MLDPMEKDAAMELCSTLDAKIFHYEEANGATEETKEDAREIYAFEERIRFKTAEVTWQEVIDFSDKLLPKYSN